MCVLPVFRQPVKGSGRYPQGRNRGFPAAPQPGHPLPDAVSNVGPKFLKSARRRTQQREKRGRAGERNDDDGTGG